MANGLKDATDHPGNDLGIGKWVFLLACCVYVLTVEGHHWCTDSAAIQEVTESIVERGTLKVPTDYTWAQTRPGWSYYNTGLSVFAVPFYFLGKLAGSLFPGRSPGPIIDLFVSFSNAVFSALIVWLFFRFARRLKRDAWSALPAALILGFCTMLWDRSKYFMREPLTALCLLGCVHFLHEFARTGARRRLFWAGCSFLVMVWTRFDQWMLLPFLTVYPIIARPCEAKERGKIRELLGRAGIFLAIPLLSIPVFLIFDWLKFGSPFKFGYSYLGLTATPLWLGLTGLLFSGMNGLLIYAAPVVIGVAGIGRLWKADRHLVLLIVSVSLFELVFFSKYAIWSGGLVNAGPRFLLPVIPLLMLPAVYLIDFHENKGWTTAGVIFLSLGGFLVQLVMALNSYFVFLYRFVLFFGDEGEYETPIRFLFSPLSTFIQQFRSGELDVIWTSLSEHGLPKALLIIPVLCVTAAGLSLFKLKAGFPAGKRDPEDRRPAIDRGKKRILIFLGSLSAACAALVLSERLLIPRGLDLKIYRTPQQMQTPVAAMSRQLPLVDDYHHIPATVQGAARAALWEGFFHIPSYHFHNYFFLSAKGNAYVTINGKLIFSPPEKGADAVYTLGKRSDLTKGYYPIQILYSAAEKSPYLNLRWTIQDFAFRNIIDQDYFFSSKPGKFGNFLIETEFYFLALSGVCLFLFTGLMFEHRRSAGSGGPAIPPSFLSS